MNYSIFPYFVFMLCLPFSNLVSQNTKLSTDQFIDERDGQSYEIILVDSLWWFNQNLNFVTKNSDCFNRKDIPCNQFSRLYSQKEAENICPKNWRLPTTSEFDDLGNFLDGNEKGKGNGLFHLEHLWTDINQKEASGIQFHKNGMKHKKKFRGSHSFNIWLMANDEKKAPHIHMYEIALKKGSDETLIIFRHEHEKHNSIRFKRKFGVRCVCELN